MGKHGVPSKLVCTVVGFGLLSSMVLGCSSGATPTPSATTTKTPTPTATVAPKPTTTPAASGQPQYGGTLKIGYIVEADSLGYPAKQAATLYTTIQAEPALETLLRTDATGNQIPWLASAFKTDAAAKTIIFTIRKGVKFHDGTDFNAAAVKWNLDQFIAAKSAYTNLVGSVDVVDDYTVRLNLTKWTSVVLGNFNQPGGLIISPTAFQTNGQDWATAHPIGTGPFKFVTWNRGASISYSKFDGYWQQGKPYLDGVQAVLISDSTTREISLRAGEIDAAYSLVSTNLPTLRTNNFVVTLRAGVAGANCLVPDSANPKSPFADVRVRQAAAYAIDTPTLAKAVFGQDGAGITNQLTFQGGYAYDPSIVGYPYDPAKAKQLLTAAGYPNGFQTRLQSWSDTLRGSYLTGVQGYLKAVGIDAGIDVLQQPQIMAMQMSGATWQGLALGRFNADPDWVSAMNVIYNGNGSYVNMIVPDDYSQALSGALVATDFATKQKLAQQANKLAVDKYCMMIPSYMFVDSVTSWPNVHGTGLYELDTTIWTPETSWLSKK